MTTMPDDREPRHLESTDRPKGMHQETYEEIVEELETIGRQWTEEAFLEPLERHIDEVEPWSFEAADGDS